VADVQITFRGGRLQPVREFPSDETAVAAPVNTMLPRAWIVRGVDIEPLCKGVLVECLRKTPNVPQGPPAIERST
jgi:hypothetical protein